MNTHITIPSDQISVTEQDIPLLKTGQRLTRAEFERRYEAYPENQKAELIEGVVYMGAAIRMQNHGHPHYNIIAWSGLYCAVTPGVSGADNSTLRLDDKNEPQPDVILRLDSALGGRSQITQDDYLEGPPELIIEISASSATFDLTTKRQTYARLGVPEYLVVQPIAQQVDWFALDEDGYQLLTPDKNNILRSKIFPGLWLNPPAFWAGDMQIVLTTLQKGLASPEYAAFVKQWQR